MMRLLYNISEWFNSLEIHQQIIYMSVVITPMLVGTLIGTVMSVLCGHFVYLLGLWAKEKGDKMRRDVDNLVRYHGRKCSDANAFRSLHTRYVYYGNSKLIGLILANKIYEEKRLKGHNIGFG